MAAKSPHFDFSENNTILSPVYYYILLDVAYAREASVRVVVQKVVQTLKNYAR